MKNGISGVTIWDNLLPHYKPSCRPAELGAHVGGKRTPFFQPRLNSVARFPQLVYRPVHLWCTVPINMMHLWCNYDAGPGDRTFPSALHKASKSAYTWKYTDHHEVKPSYTHQRDSHTETTGLPKGRWQSFACNGCGGSKQPASVKNLENAHGKS